jgi:hypothetical protein
LPQAGIRAAPDSLTAQRRETRLMSRGGDQAMPVGIRLHFRGGNQAQYDTLHAHMGLDDDTPQGLLFHAAGPIYAGWGVHDFWVSYEAFDRFVAGRLRPALQELGNRGLPDPLDVHEFPVYRITKP